MTVMQIAYVGTFVRLDTIQHYSGGSVAGNKYQIGLVSALEATGAQCDYFVVLPIASFPKDAPIFVTKRTAIESLDRTRYVPYINLPVAKQVTIAISLFIMLTAWCLRTPSGPRAFIVFNAMSFMAEPVLSVGRLLRVKRIVIAADIPPPNASCFRDRFESMYETHAFRRFDALIQITRHIEPSFAPGKANIVIEGGLIEPTASAHEVDQARHVILFSGSLDENSGIQILLDAFRRVDNPDARLHVVGRGKFSNSVHNAQAQDERIYYHGYLPNDVTVQLQRRASVLVCPRMPDGYVTMYTFPSKVLEYLATGNRVVSFALEGIPDEYYDYLVVPSGNSPQALGETLLRAIEDPINPTARGLQLDFAASKRWELRSKDLKRLLCSLEAVRQP